MIRKEGIIGHETTMRERTDNQGLYVGEGLVTIQSLLG
jgi:hypothetical protein